MSSVCWNRVWLVEWSALVSDDRLADRATHRQGVMVSRLTISLAVDASDVLSVALIVSVSNGGAVRTGVVLLWTVFSVVLFVCVAFVADCDWCDCFSGCLV